MLQSLQHGVNSYKVFSRVSTLTKPLAGCQPLQSLQEGVNPYKAFSRVSTLTKPLAGCQPCQDQGLLLFLRSSVLHIIAHTSASSKEQLDFWCKTMQNEGRRKKRQVITPTIYPGVNKPNSNRSHGTVFLVFSKPTQKMSYHYYTCTCIYISISVQVHTVNILKSKSMYLSVAYLTKIRDMCYLKLTTEL